MPQSIVLFVSQPTKSFGGTFTFAYFRKQNDVESHQVARSGYERYGILHSGYASADNVKGMMSLMRSVFYTHTYGIDGGKIWYSELYADYTSFGYGDFTKKSNVDDFKPIIDYSMEHFKTHLRDKTSWQTVHSSIYDLKEGKLFITVQETDKVFEFALGAA